MEPVCAALSVLLKAAATGRPPDPFALPALGAEEWTQLGALIRAHQIAIAMPPEDGAWGLPDDLAASLSEIARAQRLRTQWMLAELRAVLALLEDAKIPAVVLKGAALAHALGHPRSFLDLDVLVAPSHLDGATAALAPLGYVLARTGRSAVYYERHHFHRVLRSRQGVILELHWDLGRPSDYFHLNGGEVRERALSLPFDGLFMRVPCESDQLLHAAQQSLREGFTEARRVLDVVRLLQAGATDDADLAGRARAGSLACALWALLATTRTLTGVGAEPLEQALRPARLQEKSLRSLDLPLLLLQQRARSFPGLMMWLLLLCAPNAAVAGRTFLSAVFPGERGVQEDGHSPDTAPGVLQRAVLSMKRVAQTTKLAAYQTWKLASRT